jgi:PBP1b-binding outer membrane lipoprotein LpoB
MHKKQLRPIGGIALLFALAFFMAGCQMGSGNSGAPVTDLDVRSRGPVSGVGIETRDVVSMTDQIMRDLLATPRFGNAPRPPQVVIDSEHFVNESSQPMNMNIITTRLRIELNRVAAGRMVFVSRENARMVQRERELRRGRQVDVGTVGITLAQAGADYRLVGRMASLDQRGGSSGAIQRYTQLSFEMLDMERGTIVWSGIYEFSRAGTDDIIYR